MRVRIEPSAKIRRKYNEVVKICQEEGIPVFLTKNGEEDLVAIAIEQFFQREQLLSLREHLVDIERRRRGGEKDLSAKEIRGRLLDMIENYKLLELTKESEYPERTREK